MTRHIVALLVFCSFVDIFESSQITYAEPAKCNSDKDCLAGQARCIRRECHCIEHLAFGDGKTKCKKWIKCPFNKDPCTATGLQETKNSHCVRKPGTQTVACRCDSGYFGRPQLPSCMKDTGADEHGKHVCLTDSNCPHYSKCVDNRCTCRFELIGNGEKCKAAPPMSCLENEDCHADKGKCVDGTCRCDGFYVGNGVQCRDAKPCPKDARCGSHATCMLDPLFPKTAICQCEVGFKKTRNGKCVECLNNSDCDQVYATCYNGMCKCKDELIKEDKKCRSAPLHRCKVDLDCDARAKCLESKCVCQGNTTGNGKYCRVSLECPDRYQCGIHGTCLVDPLLPDKSKCRCEENYSFAKDGKCVECLNNKNCAPYSTCHHGVCKCKDELIKDEKTCKQAPLHLCDEEHKCHEKAECFYGKCYCKGNMTGNGFYCRDSLPCPKEHKCGNNSFCVVDPLFPNTPICKCLLGFKKSDDGKCEEMSECLMKGLLCPNGTKCHKSVNATYSCVCKEGFRMVNGAQNFTCEEVKTKNCNCTKHAVCHRGKCRCAKGYKMDSEGQCVPGPNPRVSHQRQPGQWNDNLSRSSSVSSHVIFLMIAVLCHLAFVS